VTRSKFYLKQILNVSVAAITCNQHGRYYQKKSDEHKQVLTFASKS